MFIFFSKPIFFVLKIPLKAKNLLWYSLPEKYIKVARYSFEKIKL